MLGETPSGRLYKALVDNKKAVGAGMDFEETARPRLHPGGRPVRARTSRSTTRSRSCSKTIENVAAEPPSKEEVERAKDRS